MCGRFEWRVAIQKNTQGCYGVQSLGGYRFESEWSVLCPPLELRARLLVSCESCDNSLSVSYIVTSSNI